MSEGLETAKEDFHSADIKKFAKSPAGKIVLIGGGAAALYVGYKYFFQGTTNTASDGSSDTTGNTDAGGSGTTTAGSAVTAAGNAVASTLSSWFNGTEQEAIAQDPGDASLIDATLADVENGNVLNADEQTEWQKLLSQFGAPPQPVTGAPDLPGVAGATATALVDDGLGDIPDTPSWFAKYTGVTSAGTGLTANASGSPSSGLASTAPVVPAPLVGSQASDNAQANAIAYAAQPAVQSAPAGSGAISGGNTVHVNSNGTITENYTIGGVSYSENVPDDGTGTVAELNKQGYKTV